MRNILEVIKNVRDCIPYNDENESFINDLIELEDIVRFSAPELATVHWEQFTDVITDYIYINGDEVSDEWVVNLISEFTTQPLETVRERITRNSYKGHD